MGLKVDLGGCGKDGEWLTINADAGYAHAAPDHVANILASAGHLDAILAPESVDEMQCLHTLEHLPPWELDATVNYWRKFLKPGGTLKIIVPDVEVIAHYFVQGRISGEAMIGMLYVPPEWQQKGEGEHHRWGFTYETLENLMMRAGFTVEMASAPTSHYVEGYPVPNLGMRCTKVG